MLTIDGSMGEGGGQVLRSSLGLSLVTGRPFRIEGIRAGRRKSGLLAQHLAAVRAAAEIADADVMGAAPRSRDLTFVPGAVRPGRYEFSVGTAGSATLVLQAVLPALVTASGPSSLRVEGGTHNPWAPPFDFLEKTFLPLLAEMGPTIRARLERPGFFPAGGGILRVEVEPVSRLSPVRIEERGEIRHRRGRVLLARLPGHIAEREVGVLAERLGWPEDRFTVDEAPGSRGPGNVVMVEMGDRRLTEVFTGFGSRGVPAERVAGAAAGEALRWLESGAPVGVHLADQIMLPFALAGGGSFRTLPLSEHAKTNLEVIRRFLRLKVAIETERDGTCRVRFGRRDER